VGALDRPLTARSQTFAYDNLNRLTSATGLYGTNAYAYDSVGNRTQKTVTVPSASTDTYTNASSSNRLNSISGGAARSLTYAASGQTATDQRSPVDTWTYTIDKNGRMADAVLNSVTQASFAYDADELRIIREYVWLGALPIGYIDRLGASGASRLFFIHADHLARPQKITDSSRATVWDGVFAPFGEIHTITGGIVNVLMFPGQVYDPETGLTQNWHRDYDANIGRYLESDPIGLDGGLNTYAYAGGNPQARIDSTGLFFKEPVLGIIVSDVVVPEPSDAVWPKWAFYGGLFAAATLLDLIVMTEAIDEADPSPNPSRPDGSSKETCSTPRQCQVQYENDSEICRTLRSAKARLRCWKSAADRQAYCIEHKGEVGWPPLIRR
jgi:RHS repeat-associated protein